MGAPTLTKRLSVREINLAFAPFLIPYRADGYLIANRREQIHEGPEQRNQTAHQVDLDEPNPRGSFAAWEPSQIDFYMSPYEVCFRLTNSLSGTKPSEANAVTPAPSFNKNSSARRKIESQGVQILALENMLRDRPLLPPNALEGEKDDELVKQLEREMKVSRIRRPTLIPATDTYFQMRVKLENERQALAAFVSKFYALGLAGWVSHRSPSHHPHPSPSTHSNRPQLAQTRYSPEGKRTDSQSARWNPSGSRKPTSLGRT